MAVRKGSGRPGLTFSRGAIAAVAMGVVVLAPIAMAADSAQLAAAHQALQSGKYEAAIKAVDAAFKGGGLSSEQTARGLYIRGSARLARKQPGEAIADLNAALWTGKLPSRLKSRAVEKRTKAYAAAGIRTPLPLAGRTAAAANPWAATPRKPATTARPSHKISLQAPRKDRLPDGYKAPAQPIVSVGRRDDWSPRATASVPATRSSTPTRQPATVRPTPAAPQNASQWQSATHKSPAVAAQPSQRSRAAVPRSPAWPSATRTVLNQPVKPSRTPVTSKPVTPQWNSSVRAIPRQSAARRPTVPSPTPFTTVSRPAPSPPPVRPRTVPNLINPAPKPVVKSPARAQPVVQPPLASFATKTHVARSAPSPRPNPVQQAPVQRAPGRAQAVPAAPVRIESQTAQPRPPQTVAVAKPVAARPPTAARPAPIAPPPPPTTTGSFFGGLFGTGSSKPSHITAADELQRQRTERIRAHNRRLRDSGADQAPTAAQ